MDGLSRVVLCRYPVTFAGRTWLAYPLTLGRLATIEAYHLSKSVLPLDDAAKAIAKTKDPKLADRIRQRAMEATRKNPAFREMDSVQLDEFLASQEGVEFSAWICLDHNAEHRTAEASRRWVRKATQAELLGFIRSRDIASGIHLLANLDWPDEDSLRRPERRGRKTIVKKVTWKQLARDFGELGVMPADVADMTLYQIRLMTCERDLLGGIRKADPATAKTGGKPIIAVGNNGKGLDQLARMQKG